MQQVLKKYTKTDDVSSVGREMYIGVTAASSLLVSLRLLVCFFLILSTISLVLIFLPGRHVIFHNKVSSYNMSYFADLSKFAKAVGSPACK